MINYLHRWARRGANASRLEGDVRPARNVLSAECDGVAVLLDLRRDLFFGLDEVGTLVWQEIEQGGSAASAARRICDEYDAPEDVAQRDAELFVLDLIQRGLVVRV